jgi:hypothetical protein
MADAHRTPLVMGDVFHDAGRVLVQRGLLLLPLALILLTSGASGAAWLRHHPLLPGAGTLVGAANWGVNWLVQAAPHSLFIAAATWVSAQTLEGRPPSFEETMREGLRWALPVLIVQALYLLGMMAGMVLLVVPGIIVALMWVLVSQTLVVERLGIIDAFKRSRVLTKGHRWTLLGLLILYTLIVVALEWVIFQITTPGMSFVQAANAPANAYGVVPLITALSGPPTMVVTTAIYMRLSSGHRAPADVTAEVFA